MNARGVSVTMSVAPMMTRSLNCWFSLTTSVETSVPGIQSITWSPIVISTFSGFMDYQQKKS